MLKGNRVDSPSEDGPVSKVRKRPQESYDSAEIFSDEDFDAGDFVEHMDEKKTSHGSRAGMRRLEEMRELRELKMALDDWVDVDD